MSSRMCNVVRNHMYYTSTHFILMKETKLNKKNPQ